MLDLLIAHDLIQRRAHDRFEQGAGAEGKVQDVGQAPRPRPGRALSLRHLPFIRSLARVRRRFTTRTAAEC
jgi:hypothetical protein